MVKLLITLAYYAVGIACLAFLYGEPLLLAGCLLVLLSVAYLTDRRPGDLWFIAGGAVLGPTAEAIAIKAGAWTYAQPDILGIPVWLPVAWGLACILIRKISESIRALGGGAA